MLCFVDVNIDCENENIQKNFGTRYQCGSDVFCLWSFLFTVKSIACLFTYLLDHSVCDFLDEEKNQSHDSCLSCICPPCGGYIVKEIVA